MGRNVTSLQTIKKSRSRAVGGGLFKAPANLANSRILITGCASGGSSGSSLNSPTLSAGCYAAGLFYCTYSVNAGSACSSIDAYTRARNGSASTAIGSAYAGGGWMAASDDGFVISTSAVGTASIPFAVSRDYGETWTSFTQTTTTAPANGVAISSIDSNLALFSNSDRYIEFTKDKGLTWTGSSSFNFSSNMAIMKGCKFLKDKFVLFGGITAGTAGVNTAIDVPSATYSDWTQTTVFSDQTVNDMDYDSTNGVFVAVGNNGSIATATSLSGPWTQRTSGTTDVLNGVKFGNGVWLAVGNSGRVCKSTDNGATWTTTTAGVSHYSGARSLAFAELMGANGTWFLRNSSGSTTLYMSRDNGSTWLTRTVSATANLIIASPVSVIGFTSGGSGTVYISRDGDTWNSYQTVRDGGDLVAVNKTGEKLRLAGGQGTVTTAGGDGGSTEGVGSKAPSAGLPGVGEGGNGGFGNGTTLYAPTGNGGASVSTASNYAGGGAARQMTDVIATPGRKFPGGSGCSATTGSRTGGGSSIFGRGGMSSNDTYVARAQSPGGGAGSNNGAYGSGGGAESCYRYEVTVSPNESLYIASGWKNSDASVTTNFAPNAGTALIEWEEYV